jgi:hypothetical protein
MALQLTVKGWLATARGSLLASCSVAAALTVSALVRS